MAPFSETRDFRSWWNSKTSLEQKLIVLSSLLFILSFCLVISVIVINNRKPAGGKTDLTTEVPTPPTKETSPTEETVASTIATVTTTNDTTPTTTEKKTDPTPTTTEKKPDPDPDEKKKDDDTQKKDDDKANNNPPLNRLQGSDGGIAAGPKLMTNPQMGFVH